MYAKRAMRCSATMRSDIYVLVVDTLPKEDTDVKFLWCSEPCPPLELEYSPVAGRSCSHHCAESLKLIVTVSLLND